MNTQSPATTPRIAVRWPFRVLAVLIILTGVVAIVGMALSGWHGAASARWQFLASLPGFAWLLRLGWYAAVRGRPPAAEYWPFASQRVLACYVIVWFGVMYL